MGPSEIGSAVQKPGVGGPSSSSSSSSISFTIAVDGEKPRRFRIAPGKRAVKVGRGPKNDVVLETNGISGHHLDILAVLGSKGPVLAVRDASMNGTGLQSGPGQTPLRLAKDVQVELLGCSVLLLPFKVKVAEVEPLEDDAGLRAVLRVSVNDDQARKEKPAAKVGEGASKKRRLAQAKTKMSKAQSAAAEEMMARCQAFAENMETKRRREEAVAPPPPQGPPPAPPMPVPQGSTAKAQAPVPPGPLHHQLQQQAYVPMAAGTGANAAMQQNLQQMQYASAMQQGLLSQQLAAAQAMVMRQGGLPDYGLAAPFSAAMPSAARRLGAPQLMQQQPFQGGKGAAVWQQS